MAYKGVVQLMGPIVDGGEPSSLPRVTTALAINGTTVEVSFDQDMSDTGLTTPGNYVFVGSTVITASVVTKISPTHVHVAVTGEMTEGVSNYTVTVSGVRNKDSDPIDPAYDTAAFDGVSTYGSSPGVLTVVALDERHVKVTFEAAAVNNAALLWAGSYEITSLEAPSPLPVYTVIPEAVTNPTYVTLTTDEQLDHADYTLNLIRVNDIGVALVESTDSTHLKVTFTDPATDNVALRWTGTYDVACVDPPGTLAVSEVVPEAVPSPTYVILTTDEQLDGHEYELYLIRLKRA